MRYRIEVAARTDIGRVRHNNEDSFGYDPRYGIYVVCDGMGGQAAGEVASRMAVDAVLSYFREAAVSGRRPQIGDVIDSLSPRALALGSAIQASNRAIFDSAASQDGRAGMGSTIVAVLAEGDSFSVGHVGDSRIYLLRNGHIQQLTRDHSLVMEQVRRGLMTMEEAHTSEMQNIIIRALGPEDTVEPDLDDILALPDDVLLLTSDGLTRHLSDERMRDLILNAPTLADACNQLTQQASEAGGSDNITCMLLRFVELPWYRRLFSPFS